MTAELEIITARRQGVISIPYQAIFSQDGHDFCYVVHGLNLERRRVVIGDSSHELREIVEGLREGEEVVLLPREENATGVFLPTPLPEEAGAGEPIDRGDS